MTDEEILDELARMNNELVNLQRALSRKGSELEAALARVKVLSGSLPICMHDKRIQDDRGYWNQIELFIRSHSDAEFSHPLCPERLELHDPGGG